MSSDRDTCHPAIGTNVLIMRASPFSYLALGGVWFALAAGYAVLVVGHPDQGLEWGLALAATVALLWVVWLRGFKIVVRGTSISYRDGLYRTTTVALNDLARVRDEYIQWTITGSRLRIPRISFLRADGSRALVINPKPFQRQDLLKLRSLCRETRAAS
ncbi:MAG: hypothetical protein EA425_17430 [Puniceicoccaceae bacterium]|nr:MAG: hypothetical protein EA425_17430 [Puniceicoccaceae bacterium]